MVGGVVVGVLLETVRPAAPQARLVAGGLQVTSVAIRVGKKFSLESEVLPTSARVCPLGKSLTSMVRNCLVDRLE